MQAECRLLDNNNNQLAKTTYGLCKDCYAACRNVGCQYMVWNGKGGPAFKYPVDVVCLEGPVPPAPIGEQATCVLKDETGKQLAKTYGLCKDCYAACSNVGCFSMEWKGVSGQPTKYPVVRHH